MNEKDVIDLIDLLYPYFKDRIKQEDKNAARLVDATVVRVGGPGAEIKINPYDTNTVYATVNIPWEGTYKKVRDNFVARTLKDDVLKEGDSVKVLYSESLKNAQIIAINHKGGA